MEMTEAFRFKTPSSIMIVGPSGCGKTCFTESVLTKHLNELFVDEPKVVVYCYGAWQDKFKKMKDKGIRFHEGVPDMTQLKTWFPKGGLLVLDDLMTGEVTTKKSWTCLPSILIITTSPSCICVKTCFHRASMPRVFLETLIMWWPLKILVIDWGCEICCYKPILNDGKR